MIPGPPFDPLALAPGKQKATKALIATAALFLCVLAVSISGQAPAFFIRSLDDPRDRRESRADILDTPVHPGSIVKTVALVAALERGIITPGSTHMCRRVARADGQTFTCSHPDLKRPLSPAEALAYSCNDFFVSLAPRLPREALNATRLAAGLAPIAGNALMSSAILGLEGPRTTPRAMIDVMARLVGAGKDKAVPMSTATKAVLLDGLRGAAEYGTASGLKAAGIGALAKTGTIVMPNGTALGLMVALMPADRPSRAIIVAAPGGAGADAAAIASELLRSPASPTSPASAASLASAASILSTIRLGRTHADGSTRVETLNLDDYIAQVLAGEGQPKAADAAQQALAITARTFALANRNRHRREGFDLCDTTHCQVVRASTAITRRAAGQTSGRVLLHRGQPAFVFYSAWCGGKSELASQVWPGAIDYSYEPALEDDACEDEPEWQSEVRADQLEQALRTAGFRGTRLRNLRIVSRNTSGRVVTIGVEGFTPPTISGNEFRMAVGRVAGWQSVKSTAFELDRTSTGYRFKGRGFGHGVGLCVVGAGKRAMKGATAADILKFYFPGLAVGAVPDALTLNKPASPTSPASSPSPGAPGSDVALALPGNEEDERQSLVALIRRSRDELLKLTGVTPPPRLRVTVHSSVESFGRATGQPWWVSGATDAAAIDLLPITMLRQQGQLERTIRHEVTHALLDGALAKRPMWVREGAAAYYARPQPLTRPDRVECPSDAELSRPVSAGAQREAYARAEACFARGIAEGKRWDQIR
jgi:SpoIID/LytB domain protein